MQNEIDYNSNHNIKKGKYIIINMSHRNSNLVYTDNDVTDQVTITDNQNKRKHTEDESQPRRSERIAKKTKSSNQESQEEEKNISDASSGESTEEEDMEEGECSEPVVSSSSSDDEYERPNVRIAQSIWYPRNTVEINEDEYLDIDQVLSDEPWFQNLSGKEKDYYVQKMFELSIYKENIPTIKDLLDLKISPDSIKILISERRDLNDYDKMSPDYDAACKKFLKNYMSLTSPKNVKMSDENDVIINHDRFQKSLYDRILESDFDKETKMVIYNKYKFMKDADSDDAKKYKKWLELVLSIPHQPKNVASDQSMAEVIKKMMDQMNDKIYGMEKAKEEFLCLMVNMIAHPKSKHKSIGLMGPPGIGKTMIVDVISKALGLPYEKIALGGITDSTSLEGHGFTYLGSEPGCIAKALIKMQCTNGIIFLDEIDKISQSERGKEVEHALLHITDFTQNHDFRDKYMPEIPINLSDCIFIYSMNSSDNLDPALLSRIPIIHFEGYTPKQKVTIVEKYILPDILSNYGMQTNDVVIPKESLEYLIKTISDMAGVRELKNAINSIINRINLYRLVSVNGELDLKLSFTIPDFKMPYSLTIPVIKSIIQNSDMSTSEAYNNMYI